MVVTRAVTVLWYPYCGLYSGGRTTLWTEDGYLNTFGPLAFTLGIIADLHLRPSVTKEDIQEHFKTHGTGTITEVKIMNGFGFIEYDDAMDARDVVPGKSKDPDYVTLILNAS